MSQNEEEVPTKLYYDALSVARRTSQKIHFVHEHDKPALVKHLIRAFANTRFIVIIKTKREADTLSKYLQENDLTALSVHSNKSAKECESAIESFHKDETAVLIMTDMILQAQSFSDVTFVISYNIPSEVSHYYERLLVLQEKGEGLALVNEEEQGLMDAIQYAMKVEIVEVEPEGFTPTPEPEIQEKIKKDKTKKPRHKKTKSKKSDKKKATKDE